VKSEIEPFQTDRREELTQLQDALGQLPARLRLPIVLCDLEGLSYQNAADKLGWTVPAFRNRLARGRQKLQRSMRRLGHDPAAAIAAYGLIPAVPQTLLQTTASCASQAILGVGVAGAIPASILTLTNQGLQTMLLIKLKTAGLAFIAASVLISGAVGLSGQNPAGTSKVDDPAKAAPGETDPPAETPLIASNKTAALIAKLGSPATIEKQIVDAPLKDVLEFLREKYNVKFVVDRPAFERVGKKNVDEERVQLDCVSNIRLDNVLRHVMTQVGGAAMVREDHLEITSVDQSVRESRNGVLIELESDIQPLVNVVCVELPISNVLADFARQSGRNVVLDSRIPERNRLTISVTLLNTPLDTATRVIAELVNLKTVSMDNVIFVTSREHAADLQAEKDNEAERRRATLVRPPPPKSDSNKQ
jgi:hypothetical protein